MIAIPSIPAFNQSTADAARLHQEQLTKPPGSLGRLEDLAIFYAGAKSRFPVAAPSRAFIPVFAADHGVCAEGVSAFSAHLTAQILQNVIDGGAGVAVLARQYGVELMVIDVGMTGDVTASARARVPCLIEKVRRGTRNLRIEDAMTKPEAEQALSLGLRVAVGQVQNGVEIMGVGEVGIGNTTPSAALIAAYTQRSASEVTGRGSGINDDGLKQKILVIEDALKRIQGRSDPLDIASAVGGLEIMAMAGFMLGAASHRIPVVLDGVIANAAALIAAALNPGIKSYFVAAHRSAEPGAMIALDFLGLNPLVELGMRLGEGTGSVIGISLVRSSVAVACEMATFASAGLL